MVGRADSYRKDLFPDGDTGRIRLRQNPRAGSRHFILEARWKWRQIGASRKNLRFSLRRYLDNQCAYNALLWLSDARVVTSILAPGGMRKSCESLDWPVFQPCNALRSTNCVDAIYCR